MWGKWRGNAAPVTAAASSAEVPVKLSPRLRSWWTLFDKTHMRDLSRFLDCSTRNGTMEAIGCICSKMHVFRHKQTQSLRIHGDTLTWCIHFNAAVALSLKAC